MATYNKFNAFVENQLISNLDWNADTFKVMLCNTAPVATNSVKADLTEISAGNGYTAGGTATTITHSRSSGTSKIVGTDVVFTASGGSIGPFRYAILVDKTVNLMIGYWDYGSSITLNGTNGDTFAVDLDGVNGVLTLATESKRAA